MPSRFLSFSCLLQSRRWRWWDTGTKKNVTIVAAISHYRLLDHMPRCHPPRRAATAPPPPSIILAHVHHTARPAVRKFVTSSPPPGRIVWNRGASTRGSVHCAGPRKSRHEEPCRPLHGHPHFFNQLGPREVAVVAARVFPSSHPGRDYS